MSYVYDKRVIVYPNYINSLKTVAEGRRIPKGKACENPTVHEMEDCVKYFKLPVEIENKAYSRDWMIRGRLRVELFKEDGTPVNPEVPTRRELLLRIAELVPRHPNRSKKAQAAQAQASSSNAAGSSKGKGSNKKKKK